MDARYPQTSPQTDSAQDSAPRFAPDDFRAILMSRILAVIADFLILGVLILASWFVLTVLGFLTFGLTWLALQLVVPVIFFGYFTLTLGGPQAATPGMRFQGMHASTWDRTRPGHLQALVHTILFYLSVSILTPLILLVPLFNARRRCLHDYLSGMVFVRDTPRR